MDAVGDADIIAALEEAVAATENPEGFYTTREYMAMTGIKVRPIRERLALLEEEGRLEIGSKQIMRLGRNSSVPAYRILPAS